jgi:hypothetical protein
VEGRVQEQLRLLLALVHEELVRHEAVGQAQAYPVLAWVIPTCTEAA